jgi:hypothetical protein
MMRVLRWLTAGFMVLLAVLVALAFKAVEETPLVAQAEGPSAAAVMRAKDLIRKNDPRKLIRNESREVRISGPDLEALLNVASARGLKGNAALGLYEGGAEIRYSARLPATPLGRFLNVTAQVGANGDQLVLEQVHIGALPVPVQFFRAAFDWYIKHTDLSAEFKLLKQTISRVIITPDYLYFTYVWQPEILDSARALAIAPARRERLAAAQQRLVNQMDSVGLSRTVPLASILGPLLAEAGDMAPASERANAYRDALLVTAFHLSGKNVALLIPEARQWPQPRPLTLTLRGRTDLAQHFAISAALAAAAGEPLANAIGVEKEVDDAKRGSGFSFIDLTADRAGTRLGELAVRNPERLAAALAAGLTDAAMLPSIDGLPEFMMTDEFQRRFGGVGAPAYKRMSDEIEHRIAALALFR